MLSCSASVQRCLRNGVGVANRQFSSYLRQKVSMIIIAACCMIVENTDLVLILCANMMCYVNTRSEST